MKHFEPERVLFEPEALDHQLGRKLYNYYQLEDIPVKVTASHNRVTGIPGKTPQEKYINAKKTLVVGTKKSMTLEPCRPSADYQFAIGTSCPGGCQYCYLATTLGDKPYIRVYVNIEEILQNIKKYIEKNLPNDTVFEISSTSDPLAVEHITNSLKKAINFFGEQEKGYLRVVSKFSQVDSLLDAKHNGHTRFRFSLNSKYVIRNFEHNTASLDERLQAAQKIAAAGYPLGFIIAPIMIYPGWKREYTEMFKKAASYFKNNLPEDLTFELIMHRFTQRSKKVIEERFPNTKLDLSETGRKRKWGKYAHVKYVYTDDRAADMKAFFEHRISKTFPSAKIQYFT